MLSVCNVAFRFGIMGAMKSPRWIVCGWAFEKKWVSEPVRGKVSLFPWWSPNESVIPRKDWWRSATMRPRSSPALWETLCLCQNISDLSQNSSSVARSFCHWGRTSRGVSEALPPLSWYPGFGEVRKIFNTNVLYICFECASTFTRPQRPGQTACQHRSFKKKTKKICFKTGRLPAFPWLRNMDAFLDLTERTYETYKTFKSMWPGGLKMQFMASSPCPKSWLGLVIWDEILINNDGYLPQTHLHAHSYICIFTYIFIYSSTKLMWPPVFFSSRGEYECNALIMRSENKKVHMLIMQTKREKQHLFWKKMLRWMNFMLENTKIHVQPMEKHAVFFEKFRSLKFTCWNFKQQYYKNYVPLQILIQQLVPPGSSGGRVCG